MSPLTRIVSRAGQVLVGLPPGAASMSRRRAPVRAYLGAVAQAAITTGVVALLFGHLDRADIIMLYLLGVMVVAARQGPGPATASAVLSVVAFDLFFIPPYLTLAVSNGRHLLTFAVMLLVGLVISGLTAEIRRQAESARLREARTAALYSLNRELTQLRDAASIAVCAAGKIGEIFEARALILLVDAAGQLAPVPGTDVELVADPRELSAARSALADGPAELAAIYLPLTAADRTVGVVGVRPLHPTRLDASGRALLEALAQQTATALQRVQLAQEAQAAELRARTEELRSSLLSSVSHDLRTPLAAVTGAASTLLSRGDALPPATRRDLQQAIYEEAARLGRLVANLLDMTRLESGTPVLRPEWTPIEEPIGAALAILEAQLDARAVHVEVAPGLPLMLLDAVLVGQMLVNLIENAIKYGGDGPIEVTAAERGDAVIVDVADGGPGIAAGDEARIFEKFHRVDHGGAAAGVGLGLAICRAVATAHGASITALPRPGGGAVFRTSFPRRAAPPPPPDDPLLAEGAA